VDVKNHVLTALQKKYSLPEDIDIDTFNYIEKGYMDSLGLIQFIAVLEDDFGIEFSDCDLASESFKTIGGLIRIIENKRG
jgi:acyl carrier protein